MKKYIKPETTFITLELSQLVMDLGSGSGSEKGIVDPSTNKGGVAGDGSIVMAKGAWDFSESDDNLGSKSKSLGDE